MVEAMEAGTSLLLIDEDTSATNFMIRDELMQRVIHRDMEPITPFLDRIRELYDTTASPLSSWQAAPGPIFHAADRIIQMDRYVPRDITAPAKQEARAFPLGSEPLPPASLPIFDRCPRASPELRGDRVKLQGLWAGTEYPSTGRPSICGMWSSSWTASSQRPWAPAWSTPSSICWMEEGP